MFQTFHDHERIEALEREHHREWDLTRAPQVFPILPSLRERLALQAGLLFIRIGQKLIRTTIPHTRLIRKTA